MGGGLHENDERCHDSKWFARMHLRVSAGRCVGSVWSSRMATLLRVRTVLAKYDLGISLSRQTQKAYISPHLFHFHMEIPCFCTFLKHFFFS